jgi:putative oxidoreductase
MTNHKGSKTPWTMDAGLFLIRVMVGVVFMFHGSQKLFGMFGGGGLEATAGFMGQLGLPMPGMMSAVLAGGAEFFGGLAFVVGFGTRLAAVPLVITMLVASFMVHGKAFSLQNGGMEYALTLAIISLGLGFAGSGRWALSSLWCKNKNKKPAADARSSSAFVAE